MADIYTMQDPTKQYPLPKFKKQPQRAPGLAKKMVRSRIMGRRVIEGVDAYPIARRW